jgi:hypothetical protein
MRMCALLCVPGAAPVRAEHRIQYFVGYGLYSPFAENHESATPGTGLLAVNGSHRTLIQLIWTGPNGIPEYDPLNPDGFFLAGDDEILDSRILAAGQDGIDEWGYAAALPPPFVTSAELATPVYVRVHQDDNLATPSRWAYDSPLLMPRTFTADPLQDVFADILRIETGGETVPAAGVTVQWDYCMSCDWTPETPAPPEIQHAVYDLATAGLALPIPYSYSLHAVYGADAVLPGGDWNWQPLAEGTDYTVANGQVTLLTTATAPPAFRVVRLGLLHDF